MLYVKSNFHKVNFKETPYELWKSKRPNISYFHPFGTRCYILNNEKEQLAKFDSKSDEEKFLGYSLTSI